VSTRGSTDAVLRRVAALVALVVLLTIEGPATGTTEAANLTGAIASTRRAQVSAEASMRQADKQLNSLKRQGRVARKRIKATTERLERLKERRTTARGRADLAAVELALARLRLRLEFEPPPAMPTTLGGSALVDIAEPADASLEAEAFATVVGDLVPATVRPQATGAGTTPRMGPGSRKGRSTAKALGSRKGRSTAKALGSRKGRSTAKRSSTAKLGPARGPSLATGAISAASLEIRQLESEAKRSRKVVRTLERKTRRMGRTRSALIRSLPRIRSQMAVTRQRGKGAEAALGQHIKSMSKLAHKRVAKKTRPERASKKTKPERWSGFAWPVRGRISQGYHRGHDGLDIVATRGTPIRAMAVGVVAYVGWNPWDQGRRAFVVVVAHPGGYETVYGHLQPIRRVTVGHVVKKGQLIGHMGNTGHSTGVHLHIEVRHGFRTINPMGVLPS
jgi:murein DD-endopeptidase MepM/ murein hydrolase activator NlpD